MFISIEIEGITPLLCNMFSDEAQMRSGSGTSIAAVGDRGSPKEQAEAVLYKDENGTPFVPGQNLFASIREGGRFFKNGKSKVTTLRNSLMPACVTMHDFVMPIQSRDGWTVDTRAVRNPSTGGRIPRHRPCFHDWKLRFEVELDTELMSAKMLRQVIDSAGKRIGLGDYRPDCKGPFGKYVVIHWVESDRKPVQLKEAI